MSRAGAAALLVLIAAAACGKVGNPLPPIVRTPQQVSDLRVTQNANQVILSWTNPASYVDGNAATDLSEIRILRNGVEVAREPVKAAGQPQSYALDVSGDLNSDLTFTVVVATQRRRTSVLSDAVLIHPRDAPGAPGALTAVFDQSRITLEWQPPEGNPDLVSGYRVQRSDRAALQEASATVFEDSEYEPGMTYTYAVTAVRAAGEVRIPGRPSAPIMVTAIDKNPPATPTGLRIQPLDAGTVLLEWTANKERDLKEYLVFRSDQAEPVRTVAESWTDQNYRPGLSYQLAAEDASGNSSERSMPQAGP